MNTHPRDHHDAVVTDPGAQRRLSLLLTFCIFFSVLNGTMFNVSVPDIARQFGLLPSQVSWVVSAYIVTFAIGTVTYGRLADTYPVRNLITIGLALFNAGSLLGFLSQWYPMLVFARMLQAAGSGSIPALAMLIATRFFPPDIKGRVLGMIASTVAFGGGIGPVLGGYITGVFHWRYLFLLSVVTLLTIAPFRRRLPRQCCTDGRFDVRGALLMAGTVAALLLFITLAVWWLLPLFALLLSALIVHIRRAEAPFINPALFLNRRYRSMIVTGFLTVGSIFGMMFMTPLMLRALNHLDTERIGLVLFPGAMSAAALGFLGGKLVDKRGGVPVVRAGLSFLVLGYVLLSTITGLSPAFVSLGLIVSYAGFSFLQSSMAHTISSTLPREQMGAGMGMYNMFFFTSGAVTAAVIGKLLDLSRGHAPVNPLATADAGPYSNVYLLLAGIVATAAVVFVRTFQGANDESAISKSQTTNPK